MITRYATPAHIARAIDLASHIGQKQTIPQTPPTDGGAPLTSFVRVWSQGGVLTVARIRHIQGIDGPSRLTVLATQKKKADKGR